MANEDKKDFNAMLHDNKDMPKIRKRSIVRTLSSLYFCATIVSTTKQSV